MSYAEMATRAASAGYEASKPYMQKLATQTAVTCPDPERLRAIAAALRMPLTEVQRATADQFLDYRPDDSAGGDEDVRVVVAHLGEMPRGERRRWRAMIEAAARVRDAE